jgi:perosamine synthetase
MYEEDAAAAYTTVLSGWLAYGQKSQELERKLTQLIYTSDSNEAIVCSSGTAALYLALNSLGIQSGDEVILPTYTCTAVLNAVLQINADPILVDINERNLGLSFDNVKSKITAKTKAIIIIHTYGIPCEIDDFKTLSIPIIEDCSQSLGSRFKDGTSTGSKGDIAVFSFYATKMVTGGYGGAVLTQNKIFLEQLRNYINFDQPEEFVPRFNFLLSDINASIIISQLEKLDAFLQKRQSISKRYTAVIHDKFLKYTHHAGQNYYRFLLFFDTKEELLQASDKFKYNNIAVINPLTHPELLHVYTNDKKGRYEVADRLSLQLLSVPIYPCLQEHEIETIITILKGL